MTVPRWLRASVRLAATIAVTFLGLLLVTFLIGRVVPIDPVLAAVGERAPPDVYEQVRRELGLHLPLWQQFVIYVGDVLQGDFGESVLTANPVLEDIARVFPATLELATVATLLGVTLGVPLGVLAAVHQGRWPDHVIRVIGLVGYSVPVFWLGLIGLLVFYARLDWVAGPGRLDVFYEGLVEPLTGVILIDSALAGEWDVFTNALEHIVLPASILGYFSLAYIARMTRSFMIEQLRQEYVTTARVKGLSEARVVWRHALGNTAVPLVTVIALSYANLLEGSVLTETVFAWPGLGFYITNSLLNADMNAVLGGTIVVGCVFIGLNLLSDLLYHLLDPRVRTTSGPSVAAAAPARRRSTRRRLNAFLRRMSQEVTTVLLVAGGGAIGTLLRYWCSGLIARAFGETFPWGTLVVNVTGSALIGVVAVLTGPDGRLLLAPDLRLMIMVGVFGGFTTFSSFSLQTLALIQDGEWLAASANVGLSVALCLAGVWLGYALGALINR